MFIMYWSNVWRSHLVFGQYVFCKFFEYVCMFFTGWPKMYVFLCYG
ncbi:hypothetical protein F383_29913 [Gossypium arboreum]|uniref:Uncharacterized protein n=1 Tax=Gossypium arboreum TaxID=29729 RepID=A0A0B0MWU5_GOSAR|nr:hypothetical protein F383_29913 [Gossypium arboreum]